MEPFSFQGVAVNYQLLRLLSKYSILKSNLLDTFFIGIFAVVKDEPVNLN